MSEATTRRPVGDRDDRRPRRGVDTTLQRVERGDAGVGAGVYASVLHALGLLGDLDVVADPLRDEVGQARSDAATPRRARLPREGSS